MKIATVFGTRPEIIKMSRLIPLLDNYFDHTFIFTDQHYSRNMNAVFFEELRVRKPDKSLNLETSEYQILINSIYRELEKIKPDYTLVYGDTNSTLSAALAACKLKIPLIHVEAGLRCFDSEVPEEINRVFADHFSKYLFTPTDLTLSFLRREGINDGIWVVGNTVVDALLYYKKIAKKESKILEKLNLDREFILLTMHRQENVDNPKKLSSILLGLEKINKQVIFPIHPRTRKSLREFGFSLPNNIAAIDPLGYFDFLVLLENCSLCITDSGGLQEESITLRTPCLTIRNSTERWETIMAGGNFLVGTKAKLIIHYVNTILNDLGEKMKKAKNPYGNGDSSKKIIKILKRCLE